MLPICVRFNWVSFVLRYFEITVCASTRSGVGADRQRARSVVEELRRAAVATDAADAVVLVGDLSVKRTSSKLLARPAALQLCLKFALASGGPFRKLGLRFNCVLKCAFAQRPVS